MAIELNRQTGADEVIPHHYAFAAGHVYTSKSGNRGTYFRDPDGHLMEILTAIGGAPS